LTGGTFKDYGIPYDVYTGLCSDETINGNLYPFDPESRSKAAAPVEDRGRFTKSEVSIHSPTFSTKEYLTVGHFLITQYVYTFDHEDYAKKAFEYVENAYIEQLKAYESMMTTYDAEKGERFKNRMRKKEKRQQRVDSNREKASRRDSELKKLSEKVSN
jgi:hypothetical protein